MPDEPTALMTDRSPGGPGAAATDATRAAGKTEAEPAAAAAPVSAPVSAPVTAPVTAGDTQGGDSRFVEHYLPFLLAQASTRISQEFHQVVRAAGLSVAQWRILASLEGAAGETIGALSVLALIKQPTLSKMVLRMEADGLVTRTRVRSDLRQTVVRISSDGHRLIARLRDQAWQHQAAVLAPFGHADSERLIGMLKRLLTLHPVTAVTSVGAPAEGEGGGADEGDENGA